MMGAPDALEKSKCSDAAAEEPDKKRDVPAEDGKGSRKGCTFGRKPLFTEKNKSLFGKQMKKVHRFRLLLLLPV